MPRHRHLGTYNFESEADLDRALTGPRGLRACIDVHADAIASIVARACEAESPVSPSGDWFQRNEQRLKSSCECLERSLHPKSPDLAAVIQRAAALTGHPASALRAKVREILNGDSWERGCQDDFPYTGGPPTRPMPLLDGVRARRRTRRR